MLIRWASGHWLTMKSRSKGGSMHPVEIETALKTMKIIVDTREHPGRKFTARMKQAGIPYVRRKLEFGDYSAECEMGGTTITLEEAVAIERKMDANELAMCFTHERKRFKAEFERAKECGARVYLLIENENMEKVYKGAYGSSAQYRSKMHPKSFVGSLFAFVAEYGMIPIFCKEETSGKIIRDILFYEMREQLKNA